MKTRILCIGAGLALALGGLTATAWANDADCDSRPLAGQRDGAADSVPDDATSTTLTEKLATCGSVLTPPPLGDADIVEPAPSVGEDMNIHPDAPVQRP